jgi:hypothetical protein
VGLFGVNKEPVTSEALNDAGFALMLVTLAILIGIKPSVAEQVASDSQPVAKAPGGPVTAASDYTVLPLQDTADTEGLNNNLLSATHSINGGEGSDSHLRHLPSAAEPPAAKKWTDAMSPTAKRVFGCSASVVAGLMSGRCNKLPASADSLGQR